MPRNVTSREKRKARIRRKISGTAERPRLTVYKSLKHMYAQLIDDTAGRTLVSMGTTSKALKGEVGDADKKSDAAKKVGAALAKAAAEKGITRAVFDRNGFDYHGRIEAVAAGARDAGLEF
jgi:large subunit ribosomal protein L18